MNSYLLSITGWWWLFVTLCIIAALFSIYAYRNTVPPIPKPKKILLISLRTIALTILLFSVFEPIFTWINTSIIKPKLAVLLDNSISMGVDDATGNRTAKYKELLEKLELTSLDTNVIYYKFDSDARQVNNYTPDSIKLDGSMTDISNALRTINNIKEQTNTCAILLVSDGAFNSGNNPIYDAENFAKPIYAIGLGDTTNPKDISITSILLNEIAYIENPIPITVNFTSTGFNGNEIKISLFDNGQKIIEYPFILNEVQNEYSATIEYNPKTEGIHKITATATALEQEITDKNNSHSEYIKIIENKRCVAIFSGAPSPDFAFVKRVLSNEKGLEILEFVQKSGSEFYINPTKQLLAKADVFILCGFPINNTPSNIMSQINEELEKGKSLLFIAGFNTDYSKLKPISSHLPFQVVSSRQNEFPVTPFLDNNALANPILRVFGTDEDINIWNNLPPIFRTETFIKVSPESEILSTMKVNNVELKEPLILSRQFQASKQIAIMGYGLYRWKMLDYASKLSLGNKDVPDIFEILIDNSYRWLAVREQNKQVNVRTIKKHFNQNEKIEFIGEVYDASFVPIENANVKIEIISQDKTNSVNGKRIINMTSAGNGRYFAQVAGLPKGDYSFEALANVGSRNLGNDNGRFSIGELAIEYQNLRQNVQLLNSISDRTLGKYYKPDDISKVIDDIQSATSWKEYPVSASSEFLIWNWFVLLIIAIILFTIEWFVRKRSGLL